MGFRTIEKALSIKNIAYVAVLVMRGSLWAAQPGSAPAETPQSCPLAVHVDGFRNHKGVVGCALFKTPSGWPENDDRAYTRNAVRITADQAVIPFEHVPPGRYSIVVLHDENANHHLDRNMFRVPKEGFGFANNPHVGLAAPTWQEASVDVSCSRTSVVIHLIYK